MRSRATQLRSAQQQQTSVRVRHPDSEPTLSAPLLPWYRGKAKRNLKLCGPPQPNSQRTGLSLAQDHANGDNCSALKAGGPDL